MDSRMEIRPGRIIHIKTYPHPTNKKTAFLIHGLGGSGEQWREQIQILKEEYTLVIPDLLGHGQSDKPKSNSHNLYCFEEFRRDMLALFHRFSAEKNIVIGHSYGGALATTLALANPDMITRLVLIAPVPCAGTANVPMIYHLPAFTLEWLRPLLEKQFAGLAFDPSDNPKLVKEEIEKSRHNPMHIIKNMIAGMETIPTLDVSLLKAHTLILLGENDKLIPPLLSEKFYNPIPHRNIETIQNTAHMVMLERPEQVNQLLRESMME